MSADSLPPYTSTHYRLWLVESIEYPFRVYALGKAAKAQRATADGSGGDGSAIEMALGVRFGGSNDS
jgi:hypothetical protein